MNKIFEFIKKHFITKKFLSFGIIGVANTGIDLLVYYLFYWFVTVESPFWSKTVAFIVASIFSYFANVIFTFKPKRKSTVQFSIVMLVFVLRLLITSGLTTLFDYIAVDLLSLDYTANRILSLIPSFIASALLIPIAYFALDWVFKKTDKEIND